MVTKDKILGVKINVILLKLLRVRDYTTVICLEALSLCNYVHSEAEQIKMKDYDYGRGESGLFCWTYGKAGRA